MGSVLAQALPISIGAALSVMPILVVILLLTGGRGAVNALLFTVGYAAALIGWGAVILAIGGGGSGGTEDSSVASAINLVLGLLFLVMALKKLSDHPDPDDPPPKWMEGLSSITAGKSFGFGFVFSALNIKNLAIYASALGVIALGGLTTAQTVIAWLLVIVVICSGLIIPVVAYAVMGDRADALLNSMREWLERNQRVITIGVLLVFGTVFLAKGLVGLL